MAELQVDRLTVGYGTRAVLPSLTFSVEAGDYLCLLGENGSGKTTLMKTILGLQPPLQGRVIFGEGLTSRRIGYLPQQAAAQKDFPASVREVVLSGGQGKLGLRPFYGRKEKKAAEEAMARMGISQLREDCYYELSGGQQQRVLLARALLAADRLLVLDEPVTGLDPQTSQEMYRLIQELNQEGMTILMISHDLEAALRYASHILYLKQPVFYGTTAAFQAAYPDLLEETAQGAGGEEK